MEEKTFRGAEGAAVRIFLGNFSFMSIPRDILPVRISGGKVLCYDM